MDELVAREIACRHHAGQHDRAGELLIEHVARVAAAVPPATRPVAWLHDLLERTAVRPAELEADGLSAVERAALELLTRSPDEPFASYVLRIVHAPGPAGELARTIKAADLQRSHRARAGGPGGSRRTAVSVGVAPSRRLRGADTARQRGVPAPAARWRHHPAGMTGGRLALNRTWTVAFLIGLATVTATGFGWRAAQIGSTAAFDDRQSIGETVRVEQAAVQRTVALETAARAYARYRADYARAGTLHACASHSGTARRDPSRGERRRLRRLGGLRRPAASADLLRAGSTSRGASVR